ncbi:peptidase MA family metallohydrolase [Gordonia caeni]|uniref:Peptidase MA-like domain-containing protein n=1 Tax=Gordonia caeni TaxID=1007097 RepID=A0ABP7PDB9_9ACTN
MRGADRVGPARRSQPIGRRSLLGTGLALTVLLGGVTACGSDEPTSAPAPSSSIFTTPPSVYEEQRAEGVSALLDSLTKALTSGKRDQLDALIDPLATRDFRDSLYQAQEDLGPTPASSRAEPSQPTTSEPTSADRDAPDRGADDSAVATPSSRRPGASATHSAPPPASRGGNLVLRTLDYRLAVNTGADRLIGGALGVKLSEAGSSDSWVSAVKLTYALGGTARPGVDEPVIELPQVLAFSRYGDEWKLLGDGSLAPDPDADPDEPTRPPELAPWAFGGLRAADVRTAGGTSAVLSYPGTDRTVTRVRRQLTPAVAAVSDFWGDDWPRRAVVMTAGSEEQFAGFTRTEPGTTKAAAAATVFSKIDRGARAVVGQRIVLSPAAGQLSESGVAVILRHELFHVATRIETAEDAPLWLVEGVAEYVGRRGSDAGVTDVAPDLAVQVASGRLPDELPADSAFAVDNDTARLAYQTAWSFAAFVADRYDEERLRRMYLAVAQGGDTAATTKALEQSLGADRDELIDQWRSWLRREVR